MTSSIPQTDTAVVFRARKLMDKAERTDNPHEAALFSAKAAELISRHRLSPQELANARPIDDELIVSELAVGRGAYVRARISLLANIANAHDVRSVYQSTPTGSVAFLAGRRSDVELVEVLYGSLHAQAAKQMASLKRRTGAATQRERRAFLFGFADRIGEMLQESSRVARVETERSGHGSTVAVALRDRQARVDDFADREWGRVRAASRPKPVSPEGYERGGEAAERADVGRSRLSGRGALGTRSR